MSFASVWHTFSRGPRYKDGGGVGGDWECHHTHDVQFFHIHRSNS